MQDMDPNTNGTTQVPPLNNTGWQNNPQAVPPQSNPQVNIPQGTLQADAPQVDIPKVNIPQGAPQVNIPQGNPQVNMPQGAPQVNMPQGNPQVNMPQGNIPQGNPQVNMPQGNPGWNPQAAPPQGAQAWQNRAGSPPPIPPQGAQAWQNRAGSPQGSPQVNMPQGAPKAVPPQGAPDKAFTPQGAPDKPFTPQGAPDKTFVPNPDGAPPQEPPRKKKTGLWILLGVIAAAIVVVLLIVFLVVLPGMEQARKQSEFDSAVAMMDEERYTEAEQIFTSLEDFEGAADKAAECRNLQKQLDAYNAAEALYKKENWEAAKTAFAALGDYKDAKKKLSTCQQHIDYSSAEKLMADGDYEAAIEAFTALGSFEDSAAKVTECQTLLEEKIRQEQLKADYDAALELMEGDEYEAARDAFTALGDYDDAAEQAEKCSMMIDYSHAMELGENEQYAEAKAAFEEIEAEYPDSAEWLSDMGRSSTSLLIHVCDVELAYEAAVNQFNGDSPASAKDALEALEEESDILDNSQKDVIQNMLDYIEGLELYNSGKYYDAYWKFTSASVRDSEAMAQQCIQPTPATGEIYRNPNYAGANCSLAIYPPTDDGNANYLKLYNTAEELVSCIFIRSGEAGYVELPGGEYIFKVAYGSGPWFGPDDMFGDEGSYYRMEINDGYVVNLEAGYAWELTLRTSEGGGTGMGEESVPRDSF